MQNLPTDLLRTFAMLAETGGFSRTGGIVGRSQPAISLQVKRLEELVGSQLVSRTGKKVELTEAGETLVKYARQILCLNDEALGRLIDRHASGPIRVGLPNDFAVSFLPFILGDFSREHAAASLNVECKISAELMHGLQKEEYDIVIALCDDAPASKLVKSWTEHVYWVAGKNSSVYQEDPVPLIVYPPGCYFRKRMTQSLDRYDRRWRVVFCSLSLASLVPAVSAGLGVTVLSEKTVPSDLRVLSPEESGLPNLPDIEVGIFFNRSQLSWAGVALVNHMIERLEEKHPR